jgi:hypothetical protein
MLLGYGHVHDYGLEDTRFVRRGKLTTVPDAVDVDELYANL